MLINNYFGISDKKIWKIKFSNEEKLIFEETHLKSMTLNKDLYIPEKEKN